MKELVRLLRAGGVWTAAWLALDLAWGGLIEADFSTAGLQQAYSLLLFLGGWLVIAFVFAVRALRAVRRS